MLAAKTKHADTCLIPLASREATRRLSYLVCYPREIYDIGRTSDVRRIAEGVYRFEVRQKRYLGRGTYIISARVFGEIHAQGADSRLLIDLQIGRLYLILLSIMTAFVALSCLLVFTTLLFIPLALLLISVISLHWSYLFYDRQHLYHALMNALAEKPKRDSET